MLALLSVYPFAVRDYLGGVDLVISGGLERSG